MLIDGLEIQALLRLLGNDREKNCCIWCAWNFASAYYGVGPVARHRLASRA
jgi:hypothetical protein